MYVCAYLCVCVCVCACVCVRVCVCVCANEMKNYNFFYFYFKATNSSYKGWAVDIWAAGVTLYALLFGRVRSS